MTAVLSASLAIQSLAVIWSVILLRRRREWRMGVLTALLLLMLVRQMMALRPLLESGSDLWEGYLIELPGLAVSLLAFVFVFVLNRSDIARQREASRRRATEGELRKSRERYRALTEKSPLMLVAFDADGTISWLNPAFERITGWPLHRMAGKTLDELAVPDDRERCVELTQRVLQGQTVMGCELRLARPKGPPLVAEFSVAPDNREGEVVGGLGIARDVTESSKAEAERDAALAQFEQIADGATDCLWSAEVTESGKLSLTYLSSGWERTWGYDLQESREDPDLWLKAALPEDQEDVRRAFGEAMEKKRAQTVTYRIRTKSGDIRWIEDTLGPLLDDQKRVVAIDGVARDITERMRAEAAIHYVAQGVSRSTGKDFFGVLVRHLVEALDIEHAFVGELVRNDGEEIRTVAIWSHGQRGENFEYGLSDVPCQNVVNGNICSHPAGANWQFPKKTGMSKSKVESYVGVPLFGAGGKVLGLLVVMDSKPLGDTDLCESILQIFAIRAAAELERIRAEEEVRRREERYREFVNQSTEAIWRYEVTPTLPVDLPEDEQIERLQRTMILAECNEAAARVFGFSSVGDVLGARLGRLMSHEESEEQLREFIRSGYRQELTEAEQVDSDSAPRHYLGHVLGVVENGRLTRVWGTQRDVTDLRRAEEALRESERKFRRLFEDSQDAVFISTAEGRLVDINPAGVEMFGYDSKEELLEVDIEEALYRDPRDREEALELIIEKGSVRDHEIPLKRRDGSELRVLETATAIRDETGEVVGFRGMLRDVTRQRSLEQQLLQVQRMEAVGQMAGGLAHEFNNLLTVINGHADLIRARVDQSDPVMHDAGEIKEAGKSAARLTRQLLALSRNLVLSPRVFDLSKLVSGIQEVLSRSVGERVQVVTDLDAEIDSIYADPGQIELILLNLAVNARDAMPEGGTLGIKTENLSVDKSSHFRYPELSFGSWVTLTVSDNGEGIDPETLQHIFEPFFTTKNRATSSGLGLSTVYGIVEQSEGHIRVESEPGQGATFRVFLKSVAADQAADEQETVELPTEGSETVLLVEDEDAVRRLLGRFLANQGYRVIEAADGEKALELAAGKEKTISLLLTDMVMPGMSGSELAEQLDRRTPGLRVLLMSGYTERFESLTDEGGVPAGVNFLQKPFSMETLARKVRQILDETSSLSSAPSDRDSVSTQ